MADAELERLRNGAEHVKYWLRGDRHHMSEEHFVYVFGYYFLTPEERRQWLTPSEVDGVESFAAAVARGFV